VADVAADLRFAWRVLAKDRWFTAGAILTLALAMGMARGLKDGGRLSTPPKVRRWTHALLVGQFAVTLALLNGAGLAARRFFNFYAVDSNVQTSG
jgi:hypothetical protein